MVSRKSTIKLEKKRQRLTLRKKGGSRTEIASLFPAGGYDNFNWNFYYITAHGSLSQNMFEIPANTYILNIATTGQSCTAWNSDIEGSFFADGDTKEALENRKKEIYDRVVKGLLTSSSSEGREHLYSSRDIRRNIEELYNSTDEAGGRTIAYYEPGDYMFDTEIYFRNHSFPVFTMGVYLLPMKKSLKNAIIDANHPVWTEGRRPSTNMLLSDDFRGQLNVDDNTLNQMLDKADMIYDVPENLARDVMYSSGGILQLPSTYNTLVYKGKKPENINLKYYNEEQIKKLENYLYPEGETNAEQQSQYQARLRQVSPPDVNRALIRRSNQAPFIRQGRKIPTLFDYVNHLNHIDSSPKLLIVDLCRSIYGAIRRSNFTSPVVRRMSLATRQRNLPTTNASGTARLRSQLQHSYIQRLKDAIDRRIPKADTSEVMKEKLRAISTKLESFLKKKIFDFRELRDILRTIYTEQLVGLQQPLIDLLELNRPIPRNIGQYLPFDAPTPYYARVNKFFKNKKEFEAKLKAAEVEAEMAMKQVKKLRNPTEEQKEAIKDFMIKLLYSGYRMGAQNPTEMEEIYWKWVDNYLINPTEPIIPKTDWYLEDILKVFDHTKLLDVGIDITPKGIITI